MATVERTADQIAVHIGRDSGLSAEELAEALAVPAAVVGQGPENEAWPPDGAVGRLAELEALRRHLHRTFVPEAIPLWLRTPNRYLGGIDPVELLRAGQVERVEAALEAIDSGFFV